MTDAFLVMELQEAVARLTAERDQAREERDDAIQCASVEADEVNRLTARVTELEAGLRPFADFANEIDDCSVSSGIPTNDWSTSVGYHNLRHARNLLQQPTAPSINTSEYEI